MNINVLRIDDGSKLTEADIDAAISGKVIGFGEWATRAPMAAECCTDTEDAEPAPTRKARVNWWGVLQASFMVLSLLWLAAVIYTGWRLATGR